MTPFRSIAILLCAVALTACEKNAVQDITGAIPGAQIKFFNFGLGAPSVNFYAGERKMTAISSTSTTESTAGVAYGGVGAGGLYSGIDPGQYTISGRISATTDKDLPIANITADIAQGRSYSFYLSGPYSTATKTVDGFVVEDDFPAAVDYSVAYVRFVNGIYNSSAMTMYATNTETNAELPIGSAVAYKAAGTFTAVPNGVYNIATRVSGATTNAISRTNVSFVAGRVYTISARGDITITSTTATNRPFLDNTANR
jgi:hypothetical protein